MEKNSIVYLLKIITEDRTLYKIGYTGGDVGKRVKSLQTGCPYEIHIADKFITNLGRKVETSLHNILTHKKMFGEWFDLDFSDEFNFNSLCERYENIYDVIKK